MNFSCWSSISILTDCSTFCRHSSWDKFKVSRHQSKTICSAIKFCRVGWALKPKTDFDLSPLLVQLLPSTFEFLIFSNLKMSGVNSKISNVVYNDMPESSFNPHKKVFLHKLKAKWKWIFYSYWYFNVTKCN